jgi:hypothetical protein
MTLSRISLNQDFRIVFPETQKKKKKNGADEMDWRQLDTHEWFRSTIGRKIKQCCEIIVIQQSLTSIIFSEQSEFGRIGGAMSKESDVETSIEDPNHPV